MNPVSSDPKAGDQKETAPEYVVRLCKNPLHFDPATNDISVFYDETSLQVFVVWSRGEGGVVVLGPNQNSQRFRLEDRGGDIICICFSTNRSILAVQRSAQSVDFINFSSGGAPDPVVYCQTCKGKNTRIVNLWWVTDRELIFVTNQGIEYYEVVPDKKSLRSLKTVSLGNVHWSVWSRSMRRLAVSTGVYGHIIYLFVITPSTPSSSAVLTKQGKLEIDIPPSSSHVVNSAGSASRDQRTMLTQRDVALVELYGSPYCIVIRPPELKGAPSAEIALYRLTGSRGDQRPARKTHVLKLNAAGRFKMNVVDNLILAHHQGSRTTVLFDIRAPPAATTPLVSSPGGASHDTSATIAAGGAVSVHQPLVRPLTIEPLDDYHHPFAADFLRSRAAPGAAVSYELYAPAWVSFHPNIIIDARTGCLWLAELRLESFSAHLSDKASLIDFLSRRRGAKSLMLSVMRQLVGKSERASLGEIAAVWRKLNRILKANELAEEEKQALSNSSSGAGGSMGPLLNTVSPAGAALASSANLLNAVYAVNVLSQHDVYSHVLEPVFGGSDQQRHNNSLDQPLINLGSSSDLTARSSPSSGSHSPNTVASFGYKFPAAVMTDYIASLQAEDLLVQYFVYELLINTLVRYRAFYQLHQYLQYHVIVDSKPMACLLLSLEASYPPAYQIALDMLKRLDSAEEQIIEVLLSKSHVIAALRYIKSAGLSDTAPARKYLEVAAQSGDDSAFYATYSFFVERNARLRKFPAFVSSDHCDEFVELFRAKFGTANVQC